MSGYKQLCRNVDWEREVVTMPWGQQFHFDDQTRVISLEYFLQKTRFAEKVRTLDLSLQEEAIIRAVLVLSAGKTLRTLEIKILPLSLRQKGIFVKTQLENVKFFYYVVFSSQ